MYAINHCDMRDAIQKKMKTPDFQEAVIVRAGQIIEDSQGGKKPRPQHTLAGVEIVAQAIATRVIEKGARQIAEDMNTNFDELVKVASSSHISSC